MLGAFIWFVAMSRIYVLADVTVTEAKKKKKNFNKLS